ncbi:MAG: cyclic nucleotide-binding domain-containing protein [Desulfobacterales bacterium]|nr:cyclic nucleotide-binding domain-containing protein [Desulfobacterales bacterium]
MYNVATEEIFNDGQLIFGEGDSGDWIYVIESGSVELSKVVGEKKIIIEILKTGDIFGELSFITKSPRTASATALGETKIGIIDRKYLDREFNKLSGSFQKILKTLSYRLNKTTQIAAKTKLRRKAPRAQKVVALSFRSTEGLVKAYTENMCSNGLFINMPTPMPEGEELMLDLHMPESPRTLKIECRVAWRRTETDDSVRYPIGMGVEFTKVSDEDKKLLNKELSKVGLAME